MLVVVEYTMGNCFSRPVMEEFDVSGIKNRGSNKESKENKGGNSNRKTTKCKATKTIKDTEKKCRVEKQQV